MDVSKWVKRCRLGEERSFGTVFLASPAKQDNQETKLIVVKSAVARYSSSLMKEGSFLQELSSCPEIISFLGTDVSLENVEYVYNLLLEYAPGGATLSDLIKNSFWGKLTEYEVSWYTCMLLMGLVRIHQQGIIHCRIKPSNILVFPSSQVGGAKHLKITGFGSAKRAGCDDHDFTSNTDIWSLGCTVMKMLTGKLSNCSMSELNDISVEAKDFLSKCLRRDPWNAKKLLQHPFIVENFQYAYGLARAKTVVTNPVTNSNNWWSGTSLFSDWLVPSNSSTHAILEKEEKCVKVAFFGEVMPYGPYLP